MTLGIGIAMAAFAKVSAVKADNDSKTLKITPEYEQRERFERRTNKSFNTVKDDSRNDLYTRLRPGFKFDYGQNFSGEFIYQYAHDLWLTETGNHSTDNSDLLVGFAGYKQGNGFWSAGRERLKKGNERLIGESGWNNLSNSFDVVRYQSPVLDVFAGKLGVTQSNSRNARLAGASYDTSLGETMVLFNHDDADNVRTDEYTLDQLYKVTVGQLHGEFEGVYQTGQHNDTLVQAWAVSGRLTESLTKKWSVSFESNAASGGTERNGTSTTFNNLYPTNHFFYGNQDLQGWINMGEIDLETAYMVAPKVKLDLEAHHYWLHDASDAWYSNNGLPNKYGSTTMIDPSGAFGKDVGEEYDIDAQWDITKKAQFLCGVADFQPGRFVESFVTTGKAVQQMWLYAQMNIKF